MDELGHLGMSFAPGKVQRNGLYGNWQRNLDKDLDRLVGFYNVDVLVTLLPDEECKELSIGKLLHKVQTRRMVSIPYPIKLGTVPQSNSFDKIYQLVNSIVTYMRQRKTVVVHCRGGLARTGMIVGCCCMLAFGDNADTAIARIRKVRGDALPREEQRQMIHAFFSFLQQQKQKGLDKNIDKKKRKPKLVN